MSNIPEARRYLKLALKLLDRRKPKFKAARELSRMTPLQKRLARKMRAKGYSIYKIAKILKTNHGRVSEVVSGKAHK
jgi:uncharacterized Fe-S cluster-containing protein